MRPTLHDAGSAKVDAEFFPDGRIKSNFLCNLGHGDPAKVLPKLPRLDFDEACTLLRATSPSGERHEKAANSNGMF